MIKSFRHKGLKMLFDTGSAAGIQPHQAKCLRMQLVALDTATTIEDMEIPGFKLHSLKDSDNDRWSVWVNGNWRVTFEFHDGPAKARQALMGKASNGSRRMRTRIWPNSVETCEQGDAARNR